MASSRTLFAALFCLGDDELPRAKEICSSIEEELEEYGNWSEQDGNILFSHDETGSPDAVAAMAVALMEEFWTLTLEGGALAGPIPVKDPGLVSSVVAPLVSSESTGS